MLFSKLYRLLFLVTFFLTSINTATGQQKIISGIVSDLHSEEPVPFASVQFINTSIGSQTDLSGRFSFKFNEWPADSMEITCVGYQPFRFFIDRNKGIYILFKYKQFNDGKIFNKHLFFSKLIAELFIPKTSEDQIYVLHLDRIRDNDDVRNLKWATREEMLEFGRQSPFVIQAKKNLLEHNIKANGKKLTVTKVMLIKKLLAKPEQRTRLKMIAKQFGVSEMQIRRIKSGENWGHIVV